MARARIPIIPPQSRPGARITPLLPQIQVLSLPLGVFPEPHALLAGTMLPRGFFLVLGLLYLAALAVDRLAAYGRLPGAVGVLLLGLSLPTEWLHQYQPVGPLQLETLHRVSLALLIFYAGLKTNLRRIRGMTAPGLRLGSVGVLITIAITGVALLLLAPLMPGGLPPAAAGLAVCCLGPTDRGAIEDLLESLRHRISGRLCHLLQFEAALSTLTGLLCFSLVAGLLQGQAHSGPIALHGLLAARLPEQLGQVLLHLLAGLLAGGAVGVLAPRLMDVLVRSEQMLLLVAVAFAFVAFGLGQLLGGGGMVAVYVAGVLLSNGHFQMDRFEQHALGRVLYPLNTAAELTVLLMLGLLVEPAALIAMLPLGLLLAIVLPLARSLAVWVVLPATPGARYEWWLLTGCGLRAAVPLALAVSMTEELPHLRGITPALAESLGPQLMALIFVVVLVDLLLQPLVLRRFLPFSTEGSLP